MELNADDTVVLTELIPDNLIEFSEEVLKVNKADVTQAQVEEAKAFLSMIPEATDSVFTVSDYRTKGIDETMSSPKVVELQAIVASRERIEGLTP